MDNVQYQLDALAARVAALEAANAASAAGLAFLTHRLARGDSAEPLRRRSR